MIEKKQFYCAVRVYENLKNKEFYDLSIIRTAEEAIAKVKVAGAFNEKCPVIRFTKIEIKEID